MSGSIAVGGWALDDLEVTRVQIFRDPVAGEAAGADLHRQRGLRRAARGPMSQRRSRPARSTTRAGWGFLLLTNMLPNQGNGTFRIYAYADDTEGDADAARHADDRRDERERDAAVRRDRHAGAGRDDRRAARTSTSAGR